MKYVWTFFWVFLLAHMVTYVAGAVGGATYDFTVASYLAIGMTILVYLVPAVLPKDHQEV